MKRDNASIRTISVLARGAVGLAVCETLARDRRISVVSYYTDSLGPELRKLFPKARRFTDPTTRSYAAHCKAEADCILSAHCATILPDYVLETVPHAFNLHPGLLPHGRGYWPTYWAVADASPAGCTLHRMEVRVDRGPIIGQLKVPVLPTDTGETLTRRVNEAEVSLFRSLWPKLRSGRYDERRAKGIGTYHDRAEGISVRRLSLKKKMPIGKLIDLLRAFSDSRFDGCYFQAGSKRIYMRLSLYEEVK